MRVVGEVQTDRSFRNSFYFLVDGDKLFSGTDAMYRIIVIIGSLIRTAL